MFFDYILILVFPKLFIKDVIAHNFMALKITKRFETYSIIVCSVKYSQFDKSTGFLFKINCWFSLVNVICYLFALWNIGTYLATASTLGD